MTFSNLLGATRARLYRLPLVGALALSAYFIAVDQSRHVATALIVGAIGTLAFAPRRRQP